MFLPRPLVKLSILGSLCDREVACSASDLQGLKCVWRAVSSHSSHHPQEVLLAQFSLYVHKNSLKPDSFHFTADMSLEALIISGYYFLFRQQSYKNWWRFCTISFPFNMFKRRLSENNACKRTSFISIYRQFPSVTSISWSLSLWLSINSAVQSQKGVSAHFANEQIPHFGLAGENSPRCSGVPHETICHYFLVRLMYVVQRQTSFNSIFAATLRSTTHSYIINPIKPEFTIVIFVHYKPWIAVAILGL